MKVVWKTHRDGIWPMDLANPPGFAVCATQYERRISSRPFTRREWYWSITNLMGRKLADGRAANRKEARLAAVAALSGLNP